MNTTNATLEEDSDVPRCDTNWFLGPMSTRLPCFECFDPDSQYRSYDSMLRTKRWEQFE